MKFNILAKTKLFPTLQVHGFEIAQEFKNILLFQSSIIEINVVYNDYEKSCYISIGRRENVLYELRNNAVRELLDSSLPIEQVTPEVFIRNLSALFKTKKGIALLRGDIDDFERFKTSEDNHYTFELLLQQALEAASKAWKRKDYKGFVKQIDEIGTERILKSYQLKYNIAKKEISNKVNS